MDRHTSYEFDSEHNGFVLVSACSFTTRMDVHGHCTTHHGSPWEWTTRHERCMIIDHLHDRCMAIIVPLKYYLAHLESDWSLMYICAIHGHVYANSVVGVQRGGFGW